MQVVPQLHLVRAAAAGGLQAPPAPVRTHRPKVGLGLPVPMQRGGAAAAQARRWRLAA